jgi:hypothetical protein
LAFLYHALGIPDGWDGAIAFDPTEQELLVALLVCQSLEPSNDLYVLPFHGRSLMQFSHHDVVHISCPWADGIDAIVAAMSAARCELPTTPPDATFKRPTWMGRGWGSASKPALRIQETFLWGGRNDVDTPRRFRMQSPYTSLTYLQ